MEVEYEVKYCLSLEWKKKEGKNSKGRVKTQGLISC